VIDYAESRPGLASFLHLVALQRGEKRAASLRVALVARAEGDWWRMLLRCDGPVKDLLHSVPVTSVPGLAAGVDERKEIFQQAARAFADHRGKSVPVETPALGDRVYERALYLHIAALMAVEGPESSPATLMSDVLDHEERFWERGAPSCACQPPTRRKWQKVKSRREEPAQVVG
jgi:hypothetical protein